jgi:sterol 3beta-glucosyltransferase
VETLQLPPLGPRDTDLVLDGAPIPILNCVSPHVIEPPDDWNTTSHLTGYWFLNGDDEWQPPRELVNFLKASSPPVYIGFGSMVGVDPEQVTKTVTAALGELGLRAVLASGSGGLSEREMPDSIRMVKAVPHSWLFSRVAAVVHHGGAGTVAAALRAGKPNLACPFDLDQYFWGYMLARRGFGPRPIPQKKLTVRRLVKALRILTSDEGMRQRAAETGERIRAEHGVATAVRLIEKYCARPANAGRAAPIQS